MTGADATGWKFQSNEYGNFNTGRRPSMTTAWGRRIYDQYEMEVEVEKPKNTYLSGKSRVKKAGCLTKKSELRELGVWDVIFDRAIIYDLQGKYRSENSKYF